MSRRRQGNLEQKATYETRLTDTSLYPLYEDVASLMAGLEHRLYVEVYIQKRTLAEVKREALVTFGVTGRQFNGVSRILSGKVDAALESMKLHRSSLEERISSAESWIKKKERDVNSLAKKIHAEERRIRPTSKRQKPVDGKDLSHLVKERKQFSSQIHNKRRHLANLKAKLDGVTADIEAGNPRLCFGSRKLFSKQFNLMENGYRTQEDWLADWRSKRTRQFICLGSHDETSGNQSCTVTPTGKLRLRVPNALESKYGRYVEMETPEFSYGKEAVEVAWKADQPVTYRFIRRNNGWWYLQATVNTVSAPIITIPDTGAIGVDLNANHIAVGEIDRFGNPISAKALPTSIYKRSHAQIEACLGDVVTEIVDVAKLSYKPVVAERLDFTKKKARLREAGGNAYARMLSGFAYAKFMELLKSRCAKEGVELILVNPAYTSLIGLVKFAGGYGITSHQAAAITIGRRGMGTRIKICKCEDRETCNHTPVPKGLTERLRTKARNVPKLPARNRSRHVWSDWNRYSKRLKEDFSLGRRPSEGESGGVKTPSLVTPNRSTVNGHGPPRDNTRIRDVAVSGCEPRTEVGSAVRSATWNKTPCF
jgi:IS605 OrfB family transposase